MFSWHRYRVALDEVDAFVDEAGQALELLSTRPGYLDGQVLRCLDDEGLVAMSTSWDGAGSYRRALSAPDVRAVVVPLMYRCLDEPGAFEAAVSVRDGQVITSAGSIRPGWGSGGR